MHRSERQLTVTRTRTGATTPDFCPPSPRRQKAVARGRRTWRMIWATGFWRRARVGQATSRRMRTRARTVVAAAAQRRNKTMMNRYFTQTAGSQWTPQCRRRHPHRPNQRPGGAARRAHCDRCGLVKVVYCTRKRSSARPGVKKKRSYGWAALRSPCTARRRLAGEIGRASCRERVS